ncbi:MAG: Pycsar system effector family protein [Fusobacteriaceae bacterium]
MNKKEFSLESFKNIQELIRFMDQKANFILIIYGVIIGFFVNSSSNLNIYMGFKIYSGYRYLVSILLFLLGILIVIASLIYTWIILFKILKPRYSTGSIENSIFFYMSIINKRKENFIKEVKELEDEKILESILSQVYEVSKILEKKSRYLRIVIDGMYVLVCLITMFCILEKIL